MVFVGGKVSQNPLAGFCLSARLSLTGPSRAHWEETGG
jgi:hypothetical protein